MSAASQHARHRRLAGTLTVLLSRLRRLLSFDFARLDLLACWLEWFLGHCRVSKVEASRDSWHQREPRPGDTVIVHPDGTQLTGHPLTYGSSFVLAIVV